MANSFNSFSQARQDFQETSEEHDAREQGGFPNVERDLPQHIGSRLNIPYVDNLTSFLGTNNPLAQPVDPATHVVWLLDNTAYRPLHRDTNKPGPWQAEFVAAYFARNSGKDVSKWVANIAEKIGLGQHGENKAEGEATIAHRLQPFVDTIRPSCFLHVSFPNGEVEKLGPGGRDAISSQIIGTMGQHNDGEKMQVTAIPPEVAPHGPMLIHFAEVEGWAVISG